VIKLVERIEVPLPYGRVPYTVTFKILIIEVVLSGMLRSSTKWYACTVNIDIDIRVEIHT